MNYYSIHIIFLLWHALDLSAYIQSWEGPNHTVGFGFCMFPIFIGGAGAGFETGHFLDLCKPRGKTGRTHIDPSVLVYV